MKALAEHPQCRLQTNTEVMDDFVQRSDLTWREFKTQLKEVKT
jgi:hypothetical protein